MSIQRLKKADPDCFLRARLLLTANSWILLAKYDLLARAGLLHAKSGILQGA